MTRWRWNAPRRAGTAPQREGEWVRAIILSAGQGKRLLPLTADRPKCLLNLAGNRPDRWSDGLKGWDRLRVIVNAMTRLRVCDADGTMVLRFKGEPGEASDGWTPWFDVPGRRSADHTVICGHWSALGLRLRPDLLSLDSGCVWGRSLTAVRLDDRHPFEVPCPQPGREG